MNKNLKLVQLFLFIFLTFCYGIESKENNQTLFIELFGGGLFYSINYENLFLRLEKVSFGARLGYSIIPPDQNQFIIGIPCVIGKKKSYLELNLSYILSFYTARSTIINYEDSTTVRTEETDFISIICPSIGYRYHKKHKRFNFRVGFSPLIIFDEPSFIYPNNPYFLPSGYLSFGISF